MLHTFRCCRYRFILQAATSLHLSAFAGSTLRGGFGHVFKRTVCVWPPGDCRRCLLKDRCAYPYVFETAPPPGAEKLRGLEQVPRPFVLEPPERGGRQSYRPGERFDFGLVLVGRGIGYLPYFVLTFAELGRTGLGGERGRFDVVEVLAEHPSGTRRVWSPGADGLVEVDAVLTTAELMRPAALTGLSELPRRLAVCFQTPARVRSEGRVRTALSFQEVVRALLRRLSSLCYFHCGCELQVDFKELIERASAFRTVADGLRWQEQDRFSGRQHQRIDMSGVLGRVVFEAPEASVWEPYLPLLAAGEWVHIGKGTVMGLGKYRVERDGRGTTTRGTTMPRFLLVTDTPGIKQFVFGTDPLAEVRGASALLDWLNREESERLLQVNLQRHGARLERTVYANGGAGQFVLEATTTEAIDQAVAALACCYRKETGGEVRIAWGMAEWAEPDRYRETLEAAHGQMRSRREMASAARVMSLFPFARECQSASHLAVPFRPEGRGERLLLSDASDRKRREAHESRRYGAWSGWLQHLQEQRLPWPRREAWDQLRYEKLEQIAQVGARRDYIGLVYADGNAMGRIVQDLDSVDTCKVFSDIVDGSIREACYRALDTVCAAEIDRVRQAHQDGGRLRPLPADILLLGGDDLLVILPATRALPFVLEVTRCFEELTRTKIDSAADAVRRFFEGRLQDKDGHARGMTISCGVALARASYPFYLLLDLAETLLKSSKKAGSPAAQATESWAPACVDFHQVASASSYELEVLRREDYRTATAHRRTLRPYTVERLGRLRQGVQALRGVRFPRSKINALFEAALEPLPARAERLAREIFARCEPPLRRALWMAIQGLGRAEQTFPWCGNPGGQATALADLAEAFDLFEEAHP